MPSDESDGGPGPRSPQAGEGKTNKLQFPLTRLPGALRWGEVAHTRAARMLWTLGEPVPRCSMKADLTVPVEAGCWGGRPSTSEDASRASALICCMTLGKRLRLSEPPSTTQWTNLAGLLCG